MKLVCSNRNCRKIVTEKIRHSHLWRYFFILLSPNFFSASGGQHQLRGQGTMTWHAKNERARKDAAFHSHREKRERKYSPLDKLGNLPNMICGPCTSRDYQPNKHSSLSPWHAHPPQYSSLEMRLFFIADSKFKSHYRAI